MVRRPIRFLERARKNTTDFSVVKAVMDITAIMDITVTNLL
jgi:hypothetical protein